MKKMILMLIVICAVAVNAQPGQGHGNFKFREKIEQLEKIKLIEILKLDEETTLRFFARQNEHRDENIKLSEQKDQLVDLLGEHFTSGKELPKGETFESINNKVVELEKQMISKRTAFIKSLTDILTQEQISKLIVFESKFRREIRDMILEKRGPGPNR